jgi:hypothetical protein
MMVNIPDTENVPEPPQCPEKEPLLQNEATCD